MQVEGIRTWPYSMKSLLCVPAWWQPPSFPKGCQQSRSQQTRSQPPSEAPGVPAPLYCLPLLFSLGGSDWAEASSGSRLPGPHFYYTPFPFVLNLASCQCPMDRPKEKRKKSDCMIYYPNWDSHERRGFCVCLCQDVNPNHPNQERSHGVTKAQRGRERLHAEVKVGRHDLEGSPSTPACSLA